MARVCLIFCFVLMQWPIFVLGKDSDILTSSIVNETLDNVTIPILKESPINNVTTQLLNETYINGSDIILTDPILEGFDPKSMLRYGHHRTYACPVFAEAYKCIAKCLRKGFDIAESNRTCDCNCLKDPEKAKFHKISTEYRFPTTTKPAWAVRSTSEATTGMAAKIKVIGGEYVYYQSDEGNSSEALATEHDMNLNHEHSEEDTDEHHSSEHSSEEHSSKEHSTEEHSSEEHSSKEHGSEEHGSEEHGSEEHGSEEHGSEDHASEEHHSEEHHSEEAEERADVGAENDL